MVATRIKDKYPNGGTLLEVGAGFPYLGSPIAPLRKLNWYIISIEPNPALCEEFLANELHVLQYAAYSEDLGVTDFTVYANGLSFSSLNIKNEFAIADGKIKDEFTEESAAGNGLSNGFDWRFFPSANKTKKIKVFAFTLNTILEVHHPDLKSIDVMVVDVEGFEMDVMKGIDLKKYNIGMIVLENIRSYTEYREYMDSKWYYFSERIDINDIYLKK